MDIKIIVAVVSFIVLTIIAIAIVIGAIKILKFLEEK